MLFVDEKSVRRMRIRSFRKMIYDNHFSKEYLELEQKKKELETRITACLKANDIAEARKLCEQLEEIIFMFLFFLKIKVFFSNHELIF